MNEYEDQQRRKDAQYEEAWNRLTSSERREMAKHGITGPQRPSYRILKNDDEAYIQRIAGSRDIEPDEDGTVESSSDRTNDPDVIWEALRRLIALLQSQDKVRLSMDCFALISGIQYCGESMADIARRHGVTRAAVSKRCVELSDSLGLAPVPGMRRLTTRARYERRARDIHTRNAH